MIAQAHPTVRDFFFRIKNALLSDRGLIEMLQSQVSARQGRAGQGSAGPRACAALIAFSLL